LAPSSENQMTDCAECPTHLRYLVYAAYDPEYPEHLQIHPLVHRYPRPMYDVCPDHLMGAIVADSVAGRGTYQWVVTLKESAYHEPL